MINEPKVEAAWFTPSKARGKELFTQSGSNIAEKALLRRWLDGIDGVKCQSEDPAFAF